LIITLARTTFIRNGNLNRYAFYDTGMAVTNLVLQAESFDIYVHQMAGFSVEKVQAFLQLNGDIEPITVMAVGYLGDGANLTPELLKRDEIRRPRKSITEFVYRNSLKTPAF